MDVSEILDSVFDSVIELQCLDDQSCGPRPVLYCQLGLPSEETYAALTLYSCHRKQSVFLDSLLGGGRTVLRSRQQAPRLYLPSGVIKLRNERPVTWEAELRCLTRF